jgi:type I restriction-modification system DNA methylase subunit
MNSNSRLESPPELDLEEIVERLSGEVASVRLDDDGVRIESEGRRIRVFQRAEDVPLTEEEVKRREADSVLFPISDGFLEFSDTGSGFHELAESGDHEALLRDVISDESEVMTLETGDLLHELCAEGYLTAYTSPRLAEMMTSWAVSSGDSVLDIATGSGTLLEQAARKGNLCRLTGIEIHPGIAEIARTRLGDVDNVEILTFDFLNWAIGDWEQLGSGSGIRNGVGSFDAVVGNPPMGLLNDISADSIEDAREWYGGHGRYAGAVFVAKGVRHLKPGGRGAFILPLNALNEDGLFQHLTDDCGVERIIELPLGVFEDVHASARFVLITVVKEDRPKEVRETGVVNFNTGEIPENAEGLLHEPLDSILKNRYDRYNADVVRVSHSDLEQVDVRKILTDPSIYEIITSDEFTRLGELDEVSLDKGMQSGNNELLYFTAEERAASDIDSRFFRPLVLDVPEDKSQLRIEEPEDYLLDLRDYVDKIESERDSASEEEVLVSLERDGYSNLAEYLREADPNPGGRGLWFVPERIGSFESPDIVTREIVDSPRFVRVELDDAVFGWRLIGLKTGSEQLAEYLCRLLNTPLYRELTRSFGDEIRGNHCRLLIRSVSNIPVIEDALSQTAFDRMNPFFPDEDDNDLIRLNQILIENCRGDKERDAIRRFMASRDDFAWSWLMTLPELEEFEELATDDGDAAKSFVISRFDEEILDEARQTFDKIDFFENRRELLNDLLMEFEQGHYRGFLAGITLQFEGVLTDLVKATGGEVFQEDNRTKFKRSSDDSEQHKNLGELIETYFDGIFSQFLDETIRQRRNDIAHGDTIEDDRDLAVHFFVSFYALCNAALSEYVRQADAEPGMAT